MSAAAAPPKSIPKGYRAFSWHGKTLAAPPGWRDDHVFLMLFAKSPPGRAKFEYWKAWVQAHWPEPIFYFDRWSELTFAVFCGYKEKVEELTGYKIEAKHEWWRYVSMAGGSSSGKTSRVAMWLLGNYVVEQVKTSCMMTSTSIEQLKRRTWSELLHWISSSVIGFKDVLEVVSSDAIVREPAKDDPINTKAAIFGKAVDQGGSTQAAVDRIKGVHNMRMFVAIDEGTSMPEAITKACRNLKKGTKEFQLFILANPNPNNKEDQHSQYSEPIDGWNNVTVDDEFWLTTKGGCCIHFDGLKSPGIAEPEKYHFYTNQKDIDEDMEFFGGENDPGFWSETRGFWAPGGLSNTVMDSALLDQFNTKERAVWKAGYEVCGFLDVAFEGGDRRVLYPFKVGEFTNGITGIEYQDPIIVAVDITTDKRFLHYAIASKVQEHCEQYVDRLTGKKNPILPQNFMMDTSGEGAGPFSIMSGAWSPLIQSCEFGGAADKEQMFPDRPTTWYELYANRVTMLYYVLKRYIEGDQVRGLADPETRKELTSRPKDKPRAGKIAILPKSKVKGMKHRSPDKADAAVGAAELLRKRGIVFAGSTGGAVAMDPAAWNAWADKTALADEENDYEDGNSAFAV